MDHSTRRKLLQTGLAAALLAAGGVPVSAGARTGGRLRIGLSGGPGTGAWDPRGGSGVFQTVAGAGLLFETLTEIAPDGLLRGALATAWTPSRMGRVWTLELDPEARFHDGRPVLGADVLASLDLHRAPGTPGHGIRSLITRMHTPTPHRIEITLKQANVDFPYLLSDPALVIGPADESACAFAHGIGSGPYRVSAFDGTTRLLAERVSAHSRSAQGSWFDTVEILVLPRATDRVAALADGRVDVVDRVPAAMLPRLTRRADVDVLALPATDYIRFSCGEGCPAALRTPLLAGLRSGIDRTNLGDNEAQVPVRDGPSVSSPVTRARYDPAYARATLGPFGETGLTLSMDGDLGEAGARVVSAVARQLADLGVRVTLAEPGRDAMLHVRRKTTRPTLDWTLLAGLEDQSGAAYLTRLSALPSGAEGRAARTELLSDLETSGPYFVPVLSDANLVASRRVGRPASIGQGWDTGYARLAQRWWCA